MIIGDSNIVNTISTVWTDGMSSSRMRQSERLIFARIDFLLSYLNSSVCTNAEAIANLMSVYWMELQLIKEFGSNTDLLYKAGSVLSHYVNDILELNPVSRDATLLQMLSEIKSKTINSSLAPSDLRFMAEFERDVFSQNYYINFSSGSKTDSPSSYIGDVDPDLLNEFKRVAGNLVYTQVDYSKMKTTEAKRKYAKQIAVISELCASGYGFTSEICSLGIQSSILSASSLDCDTYVSAMQEAGKQSGQNVGIGDGGLSAGVIAAIITLVGTFISSGAAIFTTIYTQRRKQGKIDANSALYDAQRSYADIPDWLALGDLDGDGKDDTLKVYGLGALLFGAYYFMKKK